MIIELELWQLITLLLAFFGCVGAFTKFMIAQIQGRQAERDRVQDTLISEGIESLREMLTDHLEEEKTMTAAMRAFEREFLNFKADLPINYVRREDYVRGQSILESKLDNLALRIQNIQLREVAK